MKFKIFLAGYILHAAIESLSQDIMGKEKYIQACNLLWIDSKITIPLALMTVLIIIYIYGTEE